LLKNGSSPFGNSTVSSVSTVSHKLDLCEGAACRAFTKTQG
jgi:hypothetical protein